LHPDSLLSFPEAVIARVEPLPGWAGTTINIKEDSCIFFMVSSSKTQLSGKYYLSNPGLLLQAQQQIVGNR
jgi:hypothetical protein